ncbi:hypothetical protein MJO28_004424 [Puccinia striiformis f. sp. tritici]|uniref:Uncharacterized protein n=1 Tax=Puccinia striiformis f. sp. tritici TaxID=168172 RepID=A0ACC0ER77_9BASI|nr:hypothetical protein MJO28_004424 [Puccinia striiformis f. sp. tritici]
MADLSIAPLTGGHGLPAYHQVISDHPSATKQNVPAVKNAKKRTPKKKSSKKQANPPSELGDGQDDNNVGDNNDESETVACVVNFKFFVLNRADNQKKSWLPISPQKAFIINLKTLPESDATTYEQFLDLVAKACKDQVLNTGSIVAAHVKTGKPVIKWKVSIPRIPGFMKEDDYILDDIDSYKLWMSTVADHGSAKTSLSLQMTNPSKVAKLAHQVQVLAKMALRKKTAKDKADARAAKLTKRKAAHPDDDDQMLDHGEEEEEEEEEDNEDDDGDDVKLYMRQIHKKNSANVLYERHLPVYVHPGNPAKYVVLTHTVMQEWGRALATQKDGVTDMIPPSGFKYKTIPANSEKLKAILAAKDDNAISTRNDPTETHVSPPRVATINEYIDFLGYKGARADEIIKTLIDNDLQTYQIFASPNLDHAALRGLDGMTLGLVTKLCDGVSPFEEHLFNENGGS